MLAISLNRSSLQKLVLLLFLGTAILCRVSMADTLEEMAYNRHFPELLEEIERRLPGATPQQRIRLLVLKAECLVASASDEAASALQAVDPRTAPARFFRVRGQWQIEKDEYGLSRKDFRQALRMKPEGRETLKVLIKWADMESRIGRDEEARERLSQALGVLNRETLPAKSWNFYYDSRYYILLRAGEEREAKDSLLLARAHLKSMNHQEGIAWSYGTEAQEHNSAGRPLQARETWEAALVAAPKMKASTLILWGFTTVFGQEDPQEIRYYAELLEREWPEELTPFEHYHLRLLQGQIWSELGEYATALKYYQLAEERAGPARRFSGRHLSISLAFHRFSPAKGSSDMEIALWTQLQAMDRLNFGTPEIATFMEQKRSKLPPAEQAAWLFELGVRLLDSEPKRSAQLFERALEKAESPFRKDFLDAVASAYLKRGRTNVARSFLRDLGQEMSHLDDEDTYKLLRLMSNDSVTQMPFQSLWFDSSQVLLSPVQALVSEELLRKSESLDEIQERELVKLEKGPLQIKRAHLYRSRGDFLFIQGRLAEAGAAYEMGRSIVESNDRPAGRFERCLALVYQRMRLREQALHQVRKSRESYVGADKVVDRLYSDAVEVSLLLESGLVEEALKLCEQALPDAKEQGKRAFQFARVRALLDLGRLEQAKESLQQMELPEQKTEFQVAYHLKLAEILSALQQKQGALDSLREAWAIAAELNSTQMREVALAWSGLDSDTVPRELLASVSEQSTGGEVGKSLLTSAEFLRVTDSWITQDPQMATGVALLPRAMVVRAAKLAKDEALVQFYVGQRDLLCMVGTSEGFFTQHLEIEREILNRWIEKLDEEPLAARQLGSVLLDPIDAVCAGRTLIILAHGELSSLSWDRLELSDGFLVEHFPWILWAGESSSQSTLVKNPKLLAMGGIIGAKLAGSRREVVAIGASVKNVLAILTGVEANRKNLLRHLPQADILHLATHSAPEYLRLSDGDLPRKEIYDLPLKSGVLVILSSCEGAKPGAQERAPVTLASSLLAAGASQVIASLERVGDREAELFFLQFYKELERDLSPPKALQRTKLKQRADSREDWFKFVILGG